MKSDPLAVRIGCSTSMLMISDSGFTYVSFVISFFISVVFFNMQNYYTTVKFQICRRDNYPHRCDNYEHILKSHSYLSQKCPDTALWLNQSIYPRTYAVAIYTGMIKSRVFYSAGVSSWLRARCHLKNRNVQIAIATSPIASLAYRGRPTPST